MSASTAYEIGIVRYPGAQVACILGLTDLFGVASKIALGQRRSGQNPLRVTLATTLRSFGSLQLLDTPVAGVRSSANSVSPFIPNRHYVYGREAF
jgi:hypothetical protein